MKLSTLLVPIVADRMYRFDRDIISEIDRLMTVDGFTYGDYHAQLMLAYKDDYPAVQMKIDDARVESELDYDFSREKTLQSFRSTRTSALSPSDKAHMMKYLQLKYTILFLQRNKFIGKYCFYGCWCLPASASFEHIGYGEPVDQIDHSCKEFTTCYNCVYNQQLEGKRCDENDNTRYSIKGVADKETKKITLFCHDPLGSCLRSRCECDKALAEKLAMHESTWNRGYHHKWGRPRFEPEIECKAKTNVTPPSISKHIDLILSTLNVKLSPTQSEYSNNGSNGG